ncbi:MAG: hypothetical protein V1777_03825 [Candidatus Micrarchaeota archaeon]
MRPKRILKLREWLRNRDRKPVAQKPPLFNFFYLTREEKSWPARIEESRRETERLRQQLRESDQQLKQAGEKRRKK